jgi:hypothetical protein
MNNWKTEPQITALIALYRYGLKYPYEKICGILRDKGYDINSKQLRTTFSDWGLSNIEHKFYSDINLDDALKVLRKELATPKIKVIPPRINKNNFKKHILCSDLHLPFVNKDLFAHILEQKADILHINGDIYDFYSISRFRKYQPITFREEFNESNLYLALLAEKFSEIYVTIGNHFWRLFLALCENSKIKDILHTKLIKWQPEEIFTENFPNIKIAHNKIQDKSFNMCFYNIVGKDFLYGHFEKTSKILGKPVIDAYEMMRKWRRLLNIDFDAIKYFVQAHTHRLIHIIYEDNAVELFESGCLCDIQEYTLQPAMIYPPPNPGYITFEQENGQTVPSSVKMIIWR